MGGSAGSKVRTSSVARRSLRCPSLASARQSLGEKTLGSGRVSMDWEDCFCPFCLVEIGNDVEMFV